MSTQQNPNKHIHISAMSTKKGKLYLICPDCNLENALINAFGQDSYFLTALGSVFDFSAFNSAEALDDFINRSEIAEIIVVNDPDCTFIRNTILKEHSYNTIAEQELARLKENNAERFAALDTDQQKELLAKLNAYRQAYELLDVAFVGDKIDNGSVRVTGLLFKQGRAVFEAIPLNI